MKMLDEELLQETLPPSFSIRREWTANLYAEKTKSYFFAVTNLLLTKKDGLVYNGNNSSGENFLESYCYLLTMTKVVKG